MQPIITIYCAFTRRWAVDLWLENLVALDYPKELLNLAFIVDTDDPWIASTLDKVRDQYRHYHLKINRDWQPNEVRPVERRRRIAEVKEQSKDLIGNCNYVLSFEDDTVFENLNLKKWLELFNGDTGFIEGVQCGRWGSKMIGAWRFDNIVNSTVAETAMPGVGIEKIDAGGFYGYLTTKQLYLDCEYKYNNEPYGPDVNWGLWLRGRGYENYIDWDTPFGHNIGNKIIMPDTDIVKYKLMKRNGDWLPVVP